MFTYTCAKISCFGSRKYNEDSIFIAIYKKNILAIAADGLGGHGGGDIASSLAIKSIQHFLKKQKSFSSHNIQEAISCANDAINRLNGPKTTIAVLYINDDNAIAAHVGDSRIYQFRGGKVLFQSQDHSVSQMAVAVGEITNDQIRSHPDRNKLLRALGSSEKIKSEITELSVKNNDAFLLCSDGFWELIYENEMEQDLIVAKNNVKIWQKNMIERIKNRLNEKSDNYSAITIIVK